MRVAVAGGSGFLGRHLLKELVNQGHEPVLITRKTDQLDMPSVSWKRLEQEPACLEGIEAVINLAGETINQRWSAVAKQRIVRSRLESTAALARWVEQAERKPKAFLQGSAIGYYGCSAHATFTEESGMAGKDFLADVVKQWEQEADLIKGVRLVKLRTGVVLGRDGGAFGKMLLPYRLGAGGPIASGKQWMSWIHVRDWAALAVFLLGQEQVEGPVNMTAPEPVQNDEFGRAVAKVLKRPHWLPVPALMLRLIFGEMADLLTQGQRVVPKRALEEGFSFRYPELDSALQELVSGKD
ncbi:TIGR01777 family protein [Xylanibacillus composti]|uniref:Epimerase n=1 Tax=Xylanibacillus composti TaxID=1572762 RepID=A0A8J4H135_9BACL|nr:TIGR01777 family oxidoreductase [Xylanibacillus composti]MDT9725054.1 TIGR01777 family protein [Xylanibacillus composti]GIQ67466.1 epimerase [Xylanibacillus composti]